MSQSKYIDLEFCLGNTQLGGRILQNGISLINPGINCNKIIQDAGSQQVPTEILTQVQVDKNKLNAILEFLQVDEIPQKNISEVQTGGKFNKLLSLIYQL